MVTWERWRIGLPVLKLGTDDQSLVLTTLTELAKSILVGLFKCNSPCRYGFGVEGLETVRIDGRLLTRNQI